MTLAEKVGQMPQVELTSLDPDAACPLFEDLKVGCFRFGGAEPPTDDPRTLVEGVNELQRHAIEAGSETATLRVEETAPVDLV